MASTMKVKAAEGTKCPYEGKPRKYITDSKTVEVSKTPYYVRLVRDGSLIDTDAAKASKTATKEK